jgi:hypothetical protein
MTPKTLSLVAAAAALETRRPNWRACYTVATNPAAGDLLAGIVQRIGFSFTHKSTCVRCLADVDLDDARELAEAVGIPLDSQSARMVVAIFGQLRPVAREMRA